MRKIILITFILAVSAFSCDDEKMIELNRPKKNAAAVPGEMLFTNGLRNMADLMSSADVNSNVYRLYAQYWAQTTYPDESQYNMVSREIPDNFWEIAYRDVLKDLHEASIVIEDTYEDLGMTEAEKNNQIAIIDVSKVYMFSVLVDMFGAVPFSEALDEEKIIAPKYDAGADVYTGLIDMLNSAIASLDENEAGFSETQDLIYEGDVAGWKRFANSLKLRLAITIEDVDPGKAQTMVTEALASGVITSNEENASIAYLDEAPNTNPVWEDLVQSGREDYVVSNTLVDKLTDLSDPRLPVFADPMDDGTFVGGVYGSGNTYAANSRIGELFHEPGLEGLLLDFSEVEFLMAEAIARGLTAPGTVAVHYTTAIEASMEYWGVEQADIIAYLAQPSVAYATAAGTWKQKIGTQAWIAYYNRGIEGWTLWRRLDFTGFNVPDGMTEGDIPRRLIFPIEEATLNNSALTAAIGLIGGSDDAQTKIFWDVN